MNNNILDETVYIKKIYSEYLNLIDYYKNLNRTSIFCRYLNQNKNSSNYDTNTNSTFDFYNSGIQFDVYDLTPLYLTNSITNSYQVVDDYKGLLMDGNTSITIYTIETPKLNDLIILDLPNNKKKEIFRVNNISSSINLMNSSNNNVTWYTLDLEYAPIIDFSKLNIINRFIYDLSSQKYFFKKDFELMIKENDHMQILLKSFEREYFDNRKECYFYLNDNTKIYPLNENKYIYTVLTNKNTYRDYFPKIKRPYRYKEFSDNIFILDEKDFNTFIIPQNILDFDINTSPNIYEICHLLKLWNWDYKDQTDKYELTTNIDRNLYIKEVYDHNNLVR